jgi:hypothetical protein
LNAHGVGGRTGATPSASGVYLRAQNTTAELFN